MPEIIVKLGDRIVQKLLLCKNQRLSIGRAPDNDIALENPAVSRRHAIIEQVDGQCILEDGKSANGTYVNGVRITKTEILDKDVITIGKHKLHFYDQTLAAAPKNSGGLQDKTMLVNQGTAPVAFLRVVQGKDKDEVYPLDKAEIKLGRAGDNDIRLQDWFVSKYHAIITRRGMVYVIQDLDSSRLARTKVNGEVVDERPLRAGDQIEFGKKIVMQFELSTGTPAQEGSGRRPVELASDAAARAEAPPGAPGAGQRVEPIAERLDESRKAEPDDPFEALEKVADLHGLHIEGLEPDRASPEPAGIAEPPKEAIFKTNDGLQNLEASEASEGEAASRKVEAANPIETSGSIEMNEDPSEEVAAATEEPEVVEDASGKKRRRRKKRGPTQEIREQEAGDKESLAQAGSNGSTPFMETPEELPDDAFVHETAVTREPTTAQAIQETAARDLGGAHENGFASAPKPAPVQAAASNDEIALWEKALGNPSPIIRKQAQRKLKQLTGRDYVI